VALLETRPRTGYLFLGVILGHVLLISAQVNSRRGVPLLEVVTFESFSEIQRVVTSAVTGVSHTWSGYVRLRDLKSENEVLRKQLADAQIALQEQRALADRASGLQKLLELRDRVSLRTAAADIIGSAATPDFRNVTIDKGTHDGLRANMAVIAPAGVVGRIVVPTPRSAKVQLLIDRNAAAGVIIERSRAQGVAVSAGDDRLRMDYVPETADIAVGDIVVTSGIDGIYPKGFVVGRIEGIEKSGGAYRRITIRPAVDFAGLEEVLVVLAPAREGEGGRGGHE
jgi:rod shape-determining protein MreC